MNRLTGDQLAFLDRFSRTPEARSLQEILGTELKAVERDLRTASGDLLLQAQGKAQMLDWLISHIGAKPLAQPALRAPRLAPEQYRA